MSKNKKNKKIKTMISNLNEKCLLKFLSSTNSVDQKAKTKMVNLLKQFGIEIKFKNFNELYDIIDEYENN